MISAANLQCPSHSLVRVQEFRVWRRRRLKQKTSVCCQLGFPNSPLETVFHSLISHLPSLNRLNPLDFLPSAVGLASGAAFYLSRLKSNPNPHLPHDIGEWLLFTSPTPFNRFAFLRCPSITLQGRESLEDLNDKVVRGIIRVDDFKTNNAHHTLVYQRTCIPLPDGGVVSLDWPHELDLKEERGMDSMVLIVPGTTQGSMDNDVRSFVRELLKCGYFPVVMNPRGCAASPVTTPRLFSAADSDDICSAIQFLNKARPWNTLMAVGCGHGANMLTKYLAEVAERTPLTAAVCIDNPFDLEEVTKSFPYHAALDQKLTSGLIDILRFNKELFQGRAKGFDVEKALSATSLRDFEREISMVSYGFKSIEEFYSKSSTRELVGNVKIPLLFIQSDDGTAPPFSIPRSSVAENPFTSMLLCSCFLSTIARKKSLLPWCQRFAVEWLIAVELGLLKGRHPLLKDVDVAINPSAGLALVESSTSDKNSGVDILNVPERDTSNGYPVGSMEDDTTTNAYFGSERNISEGAEDDTTYNVHLGSKRNISEGTESQGENHEILEQRGSEATTSVNETEQSSEDIERSQALDSARVVMNMLDVTMPGTLQEEQKKKVLIAMEQGETLMKALEGALPEDVRGKLTTAISEIVNTQGTKLNLDGIMNISLVPTASAGVKSKMQETIKEISSAVSGFSDTRVQEQVVGETPDGTDKNDPEIPDDTDKNVLVVEKHPREPESDIPSEPALEISLDQGQAQPGTSSSDETPNSGGKEANELEQENANHGNGTTQMNMEDDNGAQKDKETNKDVSNDKNKPTSTTKVEDSVSPGTSSLEPPVMEEVSNHSQEEHKNKDVSNDKNKPTSTTKVEDSVSPGTSSLEPPVMEEKPNHSQEENKKIAPADDQNNQGSTKSEEPAPSSMPTPNSPSFNVSQALDAFTGFDDSTQVAVNSVFGVLENMIAKLEEDSGQENDGKQGKSEDEEPNSTSEESPVSNRSDDTSINKEPNKSGLNTESDNLDKATDLPKDAHIDSDERQLTPSFSTHLKKSCGISSRNVTSNPVNNQQENKKMNDMIDATLATNVSDKVGSISKLPHCVTVNPFGDSMYNEYLRRYLLSQIPNTKPLDFNSTADMLLDYFPEDGQWKLLDQTENTQDLGSGSGTGTQTINGRRQGLHSPLHDSDAKEIIETSYVIVDRGKKQQPIKEYRTERALAEKPEEREPISELECTVKNIILDSLKVEVGRRLGLPDMEEMESNLALELEHVAEVVSRGLQHREELTGSPENESTSGKAGTPFGEFVIQTISLAVTDSVYLKKVVPVGVIVGSSLAALKKHYNVATLGDNAKSRGTSHDHPNNVGVKLKGQVSEVGSRELVMNGSIKAIEKHDHPNTVGKKIEGQVNDSGRNELVIDSPVEAIEKHEAVNNNTVMAGAVTAALGASALFAGQQSKGSNESIDVSSGFVGTENNPIKHENALDVGTEKDQNHMVSSLAEKAMSVAGPVVPTKSDGGLDQERLVTMLSDLGQKGGILRMVGKLALLWGGIRGAVSLTDRLISFLHIADRPLFQRLLAFVCMVLVLWSPVVIPMFPTLVQGWSSHTSTGIAEYACVIGLYTAVTILIILWGKRIRGYKDPLQQYGLDLASRTKFLDFLKGLMGGIMLVLSIHSINALLGCAHFSCYSSFPSSSADAMELLKAFGRLLLLSVRGIMTATVVVIVEEILFRSWLPEEISADFGYHRSIIISGFVFSVLQRSLRSTPGLWLLSIALSGLRQRGGGSLSIPIGIRAGILASSFILRTGGFLVYHSRYPLWVAGRHPLQPFDGGVGLSICIMLAILLYPKQPLGTKKIQRTIRE